MKNLEISDHITAAKAAALLDMTENALAKMRLDGDGPPFIKIGRRVRYPKTDFLDWLATRRFQSTTAAGAHAKSVASARHHTNT